MPYLAGLLAGLALIVAIGAQNAFVLRTGLARRHIGAVVTVCVVSDVVLIAVGAAGMGRAITDAPALVGVVRWGGAVFLIGYAALAARRAVRPVAAGLVPGGEVGADRRTAAGSGAAAVATALALTWLNPHVYLDTVLLLGGMAASHGPARWLFAAGAATGSAVWFLALGYGSRLLAPLFARPGAWRVLDGAIALVMLMLAAGLVLG